LTRRFGISTHLYHGQRLGRAQLQEIAAHGFEAVELFATRTHFDYHNDAAIADLQQWLAEAGVELQSVHAPIADGLMDGRWGAPLSLASSDPAARARAVSETETALHVARRIPLKTLVLHLGLPRTQAPGPGENSRDAARRSVEELERAAEPLGVRLAIEVIPNELSRAGSLVHFVEHDLESPAGICLDFGHAHLDGDVIDAVETVAEHLIATHLHDNRGRADDHLMPLDGTIDWAAALTAVQKIGYDGPMMFEVGAHGPAKDSLDRLKKTREKMERWLTSI
jgi:sugar phosphate isomerase/epimerase